MLSVGSADLKCLLLLSVLSYCIFISRLCVPKELCLVATGSVAATSNNRNTKVTIDILKCKAFEKCVLYDTSNIGGAGLG